MFYVHKAMAGEEGPTTSWGTQGWAAVLGDVVRSKRHLPEREELQRRVEDALASVNERIPAVQPLQPTIGDEFQGIYRDVGEALKATLLVRLSLLGFADVRFGVGWGRIVMPHRGSPFSQDGPAWWSAREAIHRVSAEPGRRGRPKGGRTAFLSGYERERPPAEVEARIREHGAGGTSPAVGLFAPEPEALVNASLVCRDEFVSGMDDRDARIVLSALEGRSHGEIARSEGISQSAVSQRMTRNGAYAVVAATEALEEATQWYR